MKFVIFHGAFGTPQNHWFPYLKNQLEKLSHKVIIPQFPIEDWDKLTKNGPKTITKNQNLNNWFKQFEIYYPLIKDEPQLVFVGHSLGPLFILHIVDKYDLKLEKAIFVAPFLTKLNKSWQIDAANATFYKDNFNFDKLKQLIPASDVIYSDNDPYVDEKYSLEFAAKMDSQTILLKGAKHMNSEAGLFEFPLILNLSKTNLDIKH